MVYVDTYIYVISYGVSTGIISVMSYDAYDAYDIYVMYACMPVC